MEDNPGYGLVVHPPVGKQLIALGEALFGYDGLGWRFSGAVCGVILVLLVVRIGRRISRSTVVGGIAGLLLICDGVTFVTSRTALLDGFLTLFVVAAFGCLIVDRDQVRERMHVALLEGRIGETPFGPRLGVRWWRFGAGVLLGLACATKWSGLYFIVFYGVMTLSFDIAARRQYRVPRPWVGALRRDLGPALYALVLIPFGVYMASYAPWFASETAVNRHEVGQSIGPHSALPIPDALRSLWHYTYGVYRFHAGLTNAAATTTRGNRSRGRGRCRCGRCLYAIDNQNVPGCGAQSCVKAVMLVGTPAMWFIAVPVLAWALWRAFVKRDWRYARSWWAMARVSCRGSPTSTGRCTSSTRRRWRRSWCWPSRMILGDILHKPNQNAERRTLGLIVVCFYLALVITNFAWLYPMLTGLPISQSTWNMEIWLPSWR